MRILHIEDDAALRKNIKEGLMREKFAVDGAENAREGVQMAGENVYDILLVDIGMPELNGFWVIRTLRNIGHTEGIFVISGNGEDQNKIEAYRAGANDFLVKPILLYELVAKIRLWMKQRDVLSSEAAATTLEVGPIKLDLLKHKVTMNDQWIILTPKEFMVLEYLIRHAGEVVTQTAIAQAVWSLDRDTSTNIVEYHVANLRKKIAVPGKPSPIQTVRGSGYMLDFEENGSSAA
jgi:two-component system, OmpR family, response regulator